ncbi:hypothetical protein O1M63_43920 [Streptomyces mirabilis]|nr:hypothetical protein [Streptomyces mirabilis]
MLGLALAVYGDTAADPAELLDTTVFPTRASVEKHLIAQLVPAVYTVPPGVETALLASAGRREPPEPAGPGRRPARRSRR